MTIKDVKKELKLTNDDIAKLFGLSYVSYATSTAKKRYEESLVRIYELITSKGVLIPLDESLKNDRGKLINVVLEKIEKG